MDAVVESKEERKDDDDIAHPHVSNDGTVTLPVPQRLLSYDVLASEYAGRLAVIQQSGGVVSIGTYRRLQALMERDIQLLQGTGRSWASEYQQQTPVQLRVCVSDADVPRSDDDDDCSDDDVKDMDAL